MVVKLKIFLREAIAELKRVNWPTRKETIRLTIVVVAISLIIAVLLGFFDIIFTCLVDEYIIFK